MNLDGFPWNARVVGSDGQFDTPWKRSLGQLYEYVQAISTSTSGGNAITSLTGDVTATGPGAAAASLSLTGVFPGSYTNVNLTVGADGRLTFVEDGTGGGGGGGSGTVTSVSVTTANGVSGSVANPTTTPAISLTLGAITPSSVVASGSVTGANLSGTNTGDQDAVDVPITDAGGYYTSTDVEGALQELGPAVTNIHYLKPVANGDPAAPEVVFYDGDIVYSVEDIFA